jgi:glycosyltransferase involved in cell wall biosynthesis
MPCLNEARTLAVCIDKARQALLTLDTSWEIIVADNGSTDGSQKIAEDHGARVVAVSERGYGNAFRGGIEAARGRYLILGDSDDSYDFGELPPFVEQMRAGHDLVMGSRFQGQIMDGAMPWSHRYIGNPILTRILNIFFRTGVSDAHCGLRAISRKGWDRLGLRTGGMEFASEMVIRAAQEQLAIAEVPVTLHKDGRDRPPHLHTFSDGWRHLRFMLMFSPSWLFLMPALVMGLIGLPLLILVPFYDITFFGHVLSIHFSLLGSTLVMVAFQLLQLGVFAKLVFVADGIGEDRLGRWALERFRVGATIVLGLVILLIGAGIDLEFFFGWVRSHYGPVDVHTTSLIVMASMLSVIGLQLVFAAFFLGILRASRTGGWAD